MAEGLLRHCAGAHFDVYSAGSEPTRVHPLAIAAMQEIGIDISRQESKSVKEFLGRVRVDYAIFVCQQAERNCPTVYPFALNKLSWTMDDPAAVSGSKAEQTQAFTDARDILKERIATWLMEQWSISIEEGHNE